MFSNRFIRGSDYVKHGHYLNAFLFGLTCFDFTGDWKLALGMMAGMGFGGIWGIAHNQNAKGNPWPTFFRGIIWAVPIMIGVCWAGYDPIWYLPAALTMYPLYRWPYRYFATHTPTTTFNAITCGEYGYSAPLWLPIVLFKYHIALLHWA